MLVTGQVSRLRGNGDQVYDKNNLTPKCFYANLVSKSLSMSRNEELQIRSEEAYLHVLKSAKLRYLFWAIVSWVCNNSIDAMQFVTIHAKQMLRHIMSLKENMSVGGSVRFLMSISVKWTVKYVYFIFAHNKFNTSNCRTNQTDSE